MGPDINSPRLQELAQLVDLRVKEVWVGRACISITASMLSGAHHLTRLQLAESLIVEPAVLAGKTRLQHLQIVNCTIVDAAGMAAGSADVRQLLSHLQQLQQLTHLDLSGTLWDGVEEDDPPVSGSSSHTGTALKCTSWVSPP
jgi:hypothetical protein